VGRAVRLITDQPLMVYHIACEIFAVRHSRLLSCLKREAALSFYFPRFFLLLGLIIYFIFFQARLFFPYSRSFLLSRLANRRRNRFALNRACRAKFTFTRNPIRLFQYVNISIYKYFISCFKWISKEYSDYL